MSNVRKKIDEKLVHYGVRLTQDQVDWLKKVSSAQGITESKLLRQILFSLMVRG